MKEKTTYYPTYAHQAIDILKEQVSREYGLKCYGRGGSMPTDIRSLSVDFQSDKEATRYSRKLWMKEKEERILKKFF